MSNIQLFDNPNISIVITILKHFVKKDHFWGLFDGATISFEKECLIKQTIIGMLNNFESNNILGSIVGNIQDNRGYKNKTAYEQLIQEGWVVEKDGYCAISQKMLVKLMGYYANDFLALELIALPSQSDRNLLK